MGYKKKKNVILISLVVGLSFFMYQLYFFLKITGNENLDNKRRMVHMLDHSNVEEIVHIRSKEDININRNGVMKGVLLPNMARYRSNSNSEFKCLKSDQIIPFEQVNDDFCDCVDQTDEPSTNACVKGIFYCDTQYQNKRVSLNQVPSSQVNDGICDCCDGSDEWKHSASGKLLSQGSVKLISHYVDKCPNICY